MKSKILNLLLVTTFVLIPACSKSSKPAKPSNVDYYTCTMHPSVRAELPGKCPICGMDLVPVMKKDATEHSPGASGGGTTMTHEFVVPIERQQQIGVTYAKVTRGPLHHTLRAVGNVDADMKRHWAFVARVDGYVQQLFVTSPGELVEKDAPLISIYSPDLLATEKELVMLLRMRDEARLQGVRDAPQRLIAASESRLRQWNVTDEQIAELERTRTPNEALTLHSPFRGVVQDVPAHQGVSVKIGDHLIDIADLSVVWVWAEFYESELSMLKTGQQISVTTASYPNERFEGKVALISSFVDQAKRTVKLRVDVPNPQFKLRPGMFANVELGMNMGEGLVVPASAVMPTGSKEIAFVDKGAGKLEPRVITLGEQIGDHYEVKSGLAEGERVVASANFLIDAESRVQGALKDFDSEETATR